MRNVVPCWLAWLALQMTSEGIVECKQKSLHAEVKTASSPRSLSQGLFRPKGKLIPLKSLGTLFLAFHSGAELQLSKPGLSLSTGGRLAGSNVGLLLSDLGTAFAGPSPVNGILEDVAGSLPQHDHGIVLEVATSVVAKDAGRGVFVRLMPEVDEVTLEAGTVLCGYGPGTFCQQESPDEVLDRRSIEFKLIGCCTVSFDGELANLCELLQRDGIKEVVGHTTVRDASGQLLSVRPNKAYTGPRIFIPDLAREGTMPDISSLGVLINDLAGGKKSADRMELIEYEKASAEANVLNFVQRLERDPQKPDTLRPTGFDIVLIRDLVFTNKQPMELGLKYGFGYWTKE